MLNEFAIRNTDFNKKETQRYTTLNKLKEIGSDSVFYFGIFLLAFFVLKSIPFLSGLLNENNLGINEVVVSSIGFVNVFFFQVFNKILVKVK